VPPEALHLLPGSGETVGATLTRDARIAGVAFTGGTDTARAIAKALAERPGAIVPLIAETGGLNAMIVDSSALHEQVTGDVLLSAFGAAGQRCSSLRLLFLQDNIAARVIDMIAGATAELRVGDPANLATDVGPVIDEGALDVLHRHERRMRREARLLAAAPLRPECKGGSFFAPCAFELSAAAQLTQEVFGPILHVLRYRAVDIERVVDAVNATGYGLTFGIHSRIDSTITRVAQRIRAGNVYVNRSMIGAVVGVQPFGGEGLSGTGPKAGGPHYMLRFALERTYTVNTTAAGGNAALLSAG
jgi:RHH-type proline utilization regulon transcriptional repressor/proline dehydrogenase/delta 1-pyrroline-5-carboxylate dehydrogenase